MKKDKPWYARHPRLTTLLFALLVANVNLALLQAGQRDLVYIDPGSYGMLVFGLLISGIAISMTGWFAVRDWLRR